MKHRPVADEGAHKDDSVADTVRELKELEAELRRTGMARQAKTCANASKLIAQYRRLLPNGV